MSIAMRFFMMVFLGSLASCQDLGSALSIYGTQSEGAEGKGHFGGKFAGGAQGFMRSREVASLSQSCKGRGKPVFRSDSLQGAGCATVFGLSLSGRTDTADNGRGAWGDNTRNTKIRGVSLPIPVIQAYEAKHGSAHRVCVEVFNPSTGKSVVAPIVDKGPSVHTGNALDLTHRVARELGSTGKDFMSYKILAGRSCASS